MKPSNDLPSFGRRLVVAVSAAGLLLLGTGCDEDGQGGVGATAALPSVVTNFGAENVNIGVGNVNWVGNPRW